MLSKDEIKARICVNTLAPNFPLGNFLEWVELQHNRQMLRYLEEIQEDLYAEERVLRAAGGDSKQQARVSHWCFYCAQLRAYYQAVIKDPENKRRLSFLLREGEPPPNPSFN